MELKLANLYSSLRRTLGVRANQGGTNKLTPGKVTPRRSPIGKKKGEEGEEVEVEPTGELTEDQLNQVHIFPALIAPALI